MSRTQPNHYKYAALLAALLFLPSACGPKESQASGPKESCSLVSSEIGAFVNIPTGTFIKGAAPLYPEESPSLRLQVQGFSIQTHEVTNAQFSAFVQETGYLTDAERGVLDGREGAGSAVFLHPGERSEPGVSVWTLNRHASWHSPEGEGSSLAGRNNEPVVHVSKRDAEAYAAWAGGRLPSEVEWEYAASLGLPDPDDQTSGAYSADGPRANTWQGIFPVANLETDGFKGAAPVGCFGADKLGLYDMIGNVWEWTDTPYGDGTHTMKGGSYLCADNFCRRYRPAARHPQDTDFSSNHIGFRIIKDPPQEEQSGK